MTNTAYTVYSVLDTAWKKVSHIKGASRVTARGDFWRAPFDVRTSVASVMKIAMARES